MSLKLIFHISDFHNLKIENNIFFFIFEGRGLEVYIRGVLIFGLLHIPIFGLESFNTVEFGNK